MAGWRRYLERIVRALRGRRAATDRHAGLKAVGARDALDEKLAPYLPERGFFVEAGGYDGVTASNTYFLEAERGWRGLIVEPDPEMYAECVAARPTAIVVQKALVPFGHSGGSIDLTILPSARSMSFVAGASVCEKARALAQNSKARTVSVEAVPLSSLLDEMRIDRVDFFSLDVEGYELQVIRGIDFARHRIDVMLVECLAAEEIDVVKKELDPYFQFQAQLTQRDFLFINRGHQLPVR
jgi:FkbM family methyltransferase